MATHDEYITVGGLATHVITVGGWLDDPLTDKHVVLVVPGNPGIVEFYTPFLTALHKQLGLPVWAISHAGHDLPDSCEEQLVDHLTHYNVTGQTQHKLDFIREYLPDDVRITFIGHSIGCKIILDSLASHAELAGRVDKCYLLFPTVERMAVTPNGQFLNRVIKPFVFLIVIASWLVYILPFVVKRFLISLWLMCVRGGKTVDMASVVVRLVRPKVLRNVFYMAYDEMDNVTELDGTAIERYGDKLTFYYGLTDTWAPLSYYADMKRRFPDVRATVCQRGFEHAFVLNEGTAVGIMVAEWIRDQRASQE